MSPEQEQELIIYDVSKADTLMRFHASDKLVRGIKGVIGSGKSSACAWEIFLRCNAQNVFRGKRKSRWAIIRKCYDYKTEILTEKRGWVKFKDLTLDDKVAQLKDGMLEFVTPIRLYQATYKGDMVKYEGEGVDFSVTPDHWMYVSKRRTRKQVWGDYEFRRAEDIENDLTVRVKRNADWDGSPNGFTEDQFEWLGFWFAEGCAGLYKAKDGFTRYSCLVVQKKPRGLKYIRNLMDEIGWPYSEITRKDGLHVFRLKVTSGSKLLIAELAKCGKAKTKAIPLWIKDAPKGHLRAFINGFLEGDGSKGRVTVAWTSSKQLADDLQEIALRAGYVANVHGRDRRLEEIKSGVQCASSGLSYSVTFVSKRKYEARLWQQRKGRYKGWHREHYEGMVYCVEVPTHVVYVRRHGKAFWCSQTLPDLKNTTLKTFLDWVPEREMPGYSHRVVRQPPMHSLLQMQLQDGTIMEVEFNFIACDLDDDVRKLKSLELTGAWINEASEIRKSIVDMAIGRCFRYPAKRHGGSAWCGVIADTNPPDDQSWWYEAAEVTRPEGWEFFDQPPALIPIPKKNEEDQQLYMPNRGQDPRYGPAENVYNIDVGFQYYMQQLANKSEDWIKIYLMGEYGTVVSGKPVYSGYVDKIHYSNTELEVFRGLPLIIGQDFGIPPAAAFAQLTPSGQLRILDELVPKDSEGKLIDVGMKQFIRDYLKPHLTLNYPGMQLVILCDPTSANMRSQADIGALTSIKEMIYAGLPAEYALTNHFQTRRDSVEGFMAKLINGEPGLIVSSKCPDIRRGFKGKYHFRKMRVGGGDQFAEQPEKNHPFSDCLAGNTLVAMADESVCQIKDVKAGDFVKTPFGPKPVTKAWLANEAAEVIIVHFEGGGQLIGTADHKIYHRLEWIPLSETFGKELFCINGKLVKVVAMNLMHGLYPVYDLTVDEEHCFYANGVLVHNCHDAIQYIAMYADSGKTHGSGPAYKSTQRRKVIKRSAKSYG